MAGWRATTTAVLLATAPSLVHGAPCSLADLGWMAGAWRGDGPATRSEERWTLAPGGRLMGSAWELHTDRPGGVIEASTIQADEGAVNLSLRHFSSTLGQAREEKDAPMVFKAADCRRNTVVFDGQGPQLGEHMTYRRSGDTLNFVGDFIHQGKPLRVELAFERSGD